MSRVHVCTYVQEPAKHEMELTLIKAIDNDNVSIEHDFYFSLFQLFHDLYVHIHPVVCGSYPDVYIKFVCFMGPKNIIAGLLLNKNHV